MIDNQSFIPLHQKYPQSGVGSEADEPASEVAVRDDSPVPPEISLPSLDIRHNAASIARTDDIAKIETLKKCIAKLN